MSEYNMGAEFSVDGVPIRGNGIPTTFGNATGAGGGVHYYVNPTTGLSGNKGLTMDKPLDTPANAYAKMTTNNHDVMVLSATSAHSASDELTVAKNRMHFWGLDAVGRYFGQRTRWTMGVTTGAAIAVVQNTGVGNTFNHIKFDSADTLSTSLYSFADGGEYTVIGNCEIVKSTDLDQTTSAVLLCNADSGYYHHCMIGSLVHVVSVNRPCVKFNRTTISGKVARDIVMEDMFFFIKTSSTDAALLHGTGATDIERVMILKRCGFVNAILSTADPDQAVEFDSALTNGEVICDDCWSSKCTAFSTTTGVWSATAVKSATGPEVIASA